MTAYSRQVVRKKLDEDCLLEDELHPSIAERLARVRELPSTAAANLLAVERDEQGIWLVWEHVPGVSLDEFLSSPRNSLEKEQLSRELKRAVSSLHAHGIVHGAIHSRNVIVDAFGKVRLTHISPLLYSDPEDDENSLKELLAELVPEKEMVAMAQADSDVDLRQGLYWLTGFAVLVGILIFAAVLWYIRG